VDVELPDGVWFDFWNGERYEGETTASIDVDLDTIPVLVRAGSFVPMIDDIQTTADYSSESLTLHYYADPSVPFATGQMYEDDGASRLSLEQGEFELLRFRAGHDGDSLSIDLRREGGVYDGRPESRELTIVIHNWDANIEEARFNGKPLRVLHNRRAKTLALRVDWDHSASTLEINPQPQPEKAVVYQVMTRLFGNTNTTNKPWGTIEENGVGKFADFTDKALTGIRELGTTHIWYTGVPHHALVRDYTGYGISDDDPDVIKGRAGSPYAVKDYYNVNPDLAVDPARRLEEFEALIQRTHANGMKVIIDIVPNHVARHYESISRPEGVEDFGANDDTSVEWARDNNFYYVVGEDFQVPEFPDDYTPLGGEPHPLVDGEFEESPAKWTGNGARAPQPAFQDWYETVKMNYGVRPDGSFAFDRLPGEARHWTTQEHATFWKGRDVPDSWTKFRDIALYWTAKGVDGFRYDMAEMVPVEFWSYLNSSIKDANPDAFLLAEVYNPSLYRDYLQLGRMDYLYDKVGLYDTLKPIMRGEASTAAIAPVHGQVFDIAEHMLHFLENHDEQRIASPDFAGDAEKAKPAMVVSALLSRSPTMVYFGQAVGEPGAGDAGFGDPTRTTIFDYWGVPAHQRWMNGGAFDGGQLTEDEKALRDFYARILNLSKNPVFASGEYAPLESGNDKLFAFARWHGDTQRIVVSNFDAAEPQEQTLAIPAELVSDWQLADGRYVLEETLYGANDSQLIVDDGKGTARIRLDPLESVVLEVGRREIVRHTSFGSNFVPPRHIDVWLPADYGSSDKTYRVLYAHDGQNLFNPEWSYYTQTDWGIDETLQRLIDSGEVEDTIVVGIWNTPDRVAEYYPQPFLNTVGEEARLQLESMMMDGPASDDYLRFIVKELKPFIDANYRTRTGRDDTVLMGSSLGGLISWYGLVAYPDVFSAAACVSTSWSWTVVLEDPDSRDDFVRYLRDATPPAGESRFYFDFGTLEMPGLYEAYQGLVDDVFSARGYEPGRLWQSRRFEGANHNEQAWNARVHIPLKFLLGTNNNTE
jgi:glycosidase/enterochelin esterase-like enzyme